jgi:hypothetical protein
MNLSILHVRSIKYMVNVLSLFLPCIYIQDIIWKHLFFTFYSKYYSSLALSLEQRYSHWFQYECGGLLEYVFVEKFLVLSQNTVFARV